MAGVDGKMKYAAMYWRMSPLALGAAGLLFAAAGRIDIPEFWAYAGLVWLSFGTTYAVLLKRRPDLVAERLKPPSDRDRVTQRVTAPLFMAHLVVAGMDVGRFSWSPPSLHSPLQILGFVLLSTGLWIAAWVVFVNPFASTAVRIQSERAQNVISAGPYALVRHPMYFGVLMVAIGSSLALGSLWSLVPALPIVGVFFRRTMLEDRMLHDELPGYREYAARVRYRLLPCIF